MPGLTLPSFNIDFGAALQNAKAAFGQTDGQDVDCQTQREEARAARKAKRSSSRSHKASASRKPSTRHRKKAEEEEEGGGTRVARAGQLQPRNCALAAVGGYVALRGGIQAFHYMRRYYLRHLLLDLCRALQELRSNYWVDFGSLLGIHRDGDLIPHDNDVDLAVFQPDWEVLLVSLQGALPQYSVRLVYPSENPESRFIRVYCPLGMADVFGAEDRGNGRVLVDCGHGDCCSIPTDLVLPTGRVEWRGVVIQVPGNVPGALECRYGPTWRVPRYMDKGADTVEANKLYARIFRALGKFGIRL